MELLSSREARAPASGATTGGAAAAVPRTFIPVAASRAVPVAVLAAVLAGCAGLASPPRLPEPVPYADTLPIAEPAERSLAEIPQLFHQSVRDEVGGALGLRGLVGESREALNVTRFDDVVGSAWYEPRNRLDARLDPTAVRRGPATEPGPAAGPLTIVSAKREGLSPGFTVRDEDGVLYLFKFDPKGYPNLSSAAGVIANRLIHAAGYHVPADYIVVFEAERLEPAREAMIEGDDLDARRMTAEDVDDVLALTDSLPDGRYRALASRFVPGTPKGPFRFEGRRSDDPNDHYRHEYRRELRGLRVVASWINHVDNRFGNTLDSYVEPGYLRHYLIDFGAALGSGTIRPHRPREGLEHNFDFWASLARALTLGFYTVGWEGRERDAIHPSIGWLPVESFDPGAWKPNWPNAAWRRRTPADTYWGAKLVAAFDDEQIRAAVAAGALPPVAADTLTKILIHRRDRIVAHGLRPVTPIERVRVVRAGGPAAGRDSLGGFTVEFADLGLALGLRSPEETRYLWRFRHPVLGRRSEGRVPAAPGDPQRIFVGYRNHAGPSSVQLRGGGSFAELEITALRSDPAGRRPGAARPRDDPRAAGIYLRWLGPGRGYEVAALRH